VKPEDTMLVLLQEKGEAVIIADLRERLEPFFHLAKAEGYRAYAGIPLLARDRMVGILAVLSRTPGRFRPEDIRFLTAIGHQIGLGIENARLFKERSRLAITDELTGLYNHRHFYRVLQMEVSRALRYQRHLSMIMLDIDHFKKYNDRWGHLAGDKALREVAGVLRRSVRDVDTVARYGGEEFAIILPETELRQAAIQAERIRAAVERHSFLKPLTISLGVAAFARGMQRGEELVQEADRALYRAKAEGRNRVCLTQPSG
ncbi:MAG: diguanylate cyclase, partial [Candidatus Methylomirabilales bacterium]